MVHLEINPCSSSPCGNDGMCVNTIDRNYTCVCKSQWAGANCETGQCYFIIFRYILMPLLLLDNFSSLHLEINPCSSSPCGNGGTCINTLVGNYTCICKIQWTGTNCETGKC